MQKYTASFNDQGKTILRFIQKMYPDIPKSRIERVFREKDIKINSQRIKDKKITLNDGDKIEVFSLFTEKKFSKIPVKANINFNVVYEDNNILIIDKKEGTQVHDGENSLDQQVLAYLKFVQKDSFIPSHIGRLDKLSSGLMVYGKNSETIRQINQTADKHIKIYEFKSDLDRSITTEFKITHDEDFQRERCGDVGKETKTIFKVEDKRKYAQLVTGRKHQIRATLSKLGKPIWGDIKYGGKKADRMYLHSTYIKFQGLVDSLEYLNGQEFNSRPNW